MMMIVTEVREWGKQTGMDERDLWEVESATLDN